MPRMTFNKQGYHNATGDEVEQLKKEGWTVITDAEFQKVLSEKRAAKKAAHAAAEKAAAEKAAAEKAAAEKAAKPEPAKA